jgi:YD repeat-containing protein
MLHRLTSDTLTSGAATVASVAYGYNAGGYLTSKTTTGFAGASASTYGYDLAGRLTSWDGLPGTDAQGGSYLASNTSLTRVER